jgi:hypothetical protein
MKFTQIIASFVMAATVIAVATPAGAHYTSTLSGYQNSDRWYRLRPEPALQLQEGGDPRAEA